jgi:iron(III) transport system substrate-binding protein
VPLDELDPPDIDLSRLEDLEGTLKLIENAGVL